MPFTFLYLIVFWGYFRKYEEILAAKLKRALKISTLHFNLISYRMRTIIFSIKIENTLFRREGGHIYFNSLLANESTS